ncbi:conserved hypothetical protein [Lebetimonas natsushimae]|uniref:Uncharacterized protein n=1 Tax=Lebetimonas natsushimae TaxID=1936991 RepID=A0A292YH89_9BACT|nr:hypothetical protein [Lebetimonas natsushimae]GAX88291.1 conserved hypothetical protein [Lebetimonas natsushimae]
MQQMILQEKYPVFILDIDKNETHYKTTNEIIKFFKNKIDSHPICTYIGEFDHYNHTKNLQNGEIAEGIKDCKIIIFCFGNKILNGKIAAVRPRSIGVTEYEDKFEIAFLEAPALIANEVMEGWVKELKNSL